MVYVVALTGGIGSGKSTVANAFMQLGVTTIDVDSIARKVMEPTTPTLRDIVNRYGSSILNANGTLNRRYLRKRIFSSPDERNWLNVLLHPLINQESQHQIEMATSPYVLWIVPLLVENQLHKKVDRVLVVDTTPETQIRRIVSRDGVSSEHAKRILSAQVNSETRLAIADDVIYNNDDPSKIISDVARLHEQYLIWSALHFSQEDHSINKLV